MASGEVERQSRVVQTSRARTHPHVGYTGTLEAGRCIHHHHPPPPSPLSSPPSLYPPSSLPYVLFQPHHVQYNVHSLPVSFSGSLSLSPTTLPRHYHHHCHPLLFFIFSFSNLSSPRIITISSSFSPTCFFITNFL